jgi:beta-lactamase superfamily II metal-dependent hydrolase
MDGGKDNTVLERLGRLFNFFDKKIDMVVATHDDLDHVGGLPGVLSRYQVDTLITSLPNSTNVAMSAVVDTALAKDMQIVHANSRKQITTDDGVTIDILFPTENMDGTEDGNSTSVVAKIKYGEVSFLLTGDLPHAGELYLISLYGDELKSDVLKLGHHGSDTSTHPKLLEMVKPKTVVVSAGKNNSFGHPHRAVIELVQKFGAQIFSTTDEGNIEFETDGLNVWKN